MCSVVGYIGKDLCAPVVLAGLTRLEYRGYDSAGFACLIPTINQLRYAKASGQLINLIEKLKHNPIDGFVGIGHTRWSTHGDFSEENAHPHFDCSKTISVVHNGIIENHDELRRKLQLTGHIFSSYTDTEVIPHLFEKLFTDNNADIRQVVVQLVDTLEGAYASVIMTQDYPDMLILIRKRSPLCIGIGQGEMFIASDAVAFAGKTEKVVFLPDESFALVTKDDIHLHSFSGLALPIAIHTLSHAVFTMDKAGYEHFMLKEIYEQKNAIVQTIASLSALGGAVWKQLGITADAISTIQRIVFIACGTSSHAARMAQFFFEDIAQISVEVCIASEFRYKSFFPDSNALYVVISQSGETADVLEALRLINAHALTVVALTNSPSSAVVREAQGFLLTHAGPEMAVAATKSFSTQLAALYWLASFMAYEKKIISLGNLQTAEQDLLKVAAVLEEYIERYKEKICVSYAPLYAVSDTAFFIGRHIGYPFALEAALKLKEIGYVFAQSYSAGELKHGALALIDATVPVYFFSHQDSILYHKLVANAHEIKSRGGRLIIFAFEGQDELIALAETVFIIANRLPTLLGHLAMTGLMQFLVYAIAKERGCPIDRPRNLAKSVTVE